MAGDISPISSRKSVPPLAASNRPTREAMAPLKAPFLWPNSSLSSSVSGSAPQLIDTKGRAARDDCRWMLRATSSLPVPLSPCTSTGLSLPATRVITASTSRISALAPTTFGSPSRRMMTSFSAEFSRRSAFFSKALATTSRSSAFLHGLVMKS